MEHKRAQQRFIDLEDLRFASWIDWEEVLIDRFGIVFKDENDELIELAEPTTGDIIHEFWKIRRSHQDDKAINKKEMADFLKKAEEVIPGFGDSHIDVTRFIVETMPVKPLKKVKRCRR